MLNKASRSKNCIGSSGRRTHTGTIGDSSLGLNHPVSNGGKRRSSGEPSGDYQNSRGGRRTVAAAEDEQYRQAGDKPPEKRTEQYRNKQATNRRKNETGDKPPEKRNRRQTAAINNNKQCPKSSAEICAFQTKKAKRCADLRRKTESSGLDSSRSVTGRATRAVSQKRGGHGDSGGVARTGNAAGKAFRRPAGRGGGGGREDPVKPPVEEQRRLPDEPSVDETTTDEGEEEEIVDSSIAEEAEPSIIGGEGKRVTSPIHAVSLT
ncbi:hypothetical protein Salat_1466200 [Sesamum alatum]|uniref:Uncharacterized protein n=1 Tax=Sesamum alatum TaxID=300844 RepID=A0AAE1YBG1_9LAMI|nr:hypothetical protein Salat_1466200 [Sesamum alatum]